jgi:ubiquinone biosynthesis protein UbiJ
MTFDTSEVLALKLSRPPAQTGGDRADDSMLDTRGKGRGQLTWKLSALDEQSGLRPNGREVLAVVTAPIAAQRLTGALDVSIRFTRRVFGVVQRSTAEPRHPLRFTLDVVDGTFETFPAADT